MGKATHIAVFSIPVFTHQASIVELCKRLLHLNHHFHVTCIFPTINSPIPATVTLLKSLPPTITHTFLPPVNKKDLPRDLSPATQTQLAVSQSMQYFRNTLKSLLSTTPPLSALVVDAFANEAVEVANEFNLASYVYMVTSATTLSLLLHLPTLHEEVSCEYKNVEVIRIPGCVAIHGRDLPDDFQDRSSLAYEMILRRSKRFESLTVSGFLVNSFYEMEEGVVRALQEDTIGSEITGYSNNNVPVYLVGPVIQIGPSSESNVPQCLGWLENQRPNSVLYLSFGSVLTISQQQMNELALGLELSGQKFFWVLKPPSDSIYGGVSNDDPLQFLPRGFLERTKGQGLVITSWAPQTQILCHTSTGGFVTHCGWNSTVESIVAGVPMITWPMCAEQRLNAALVTKGLKVGLRPKFRESDGIVEKEEIAKVVKDLMVGDEGNGIRQRIEKLKDDAADALKEHGSSTRALSQFGTQLENWIQK